MTGQWLCWWLKDLHFLHLSGCVPWRRYAWFWMVWAQTSHILNDINCKTWVRLLCFEDFWGTLGPYTKKSLSLKETFVSQNGPMHGPWLLKWYETHTTFELCKQIVCRPQQFIMAQKQKRNAATSQVLLLQLHHDIGGLWWFGSKEYRGTHCVYHDDLDRRSLLGICLGWLDLEAWGHVHHFSSKYCAIHLRTKCSKKHSKTKMVSYGRTQFI